MKSVPKLIRRFVGVLMISSFLILIANISVLIVIGLQHSPNASPWSSAKNAAAALTKTENGYQLSEQMAAELAQQNIWAIFIDNQTHQVVWHTDFFPEGIPTQYTLSNIVSLTRGYLNGYPTFTGEAQDGLMVLGYPKDSYWKHMYPSWDYHMIADFPKIIITFLAVNFFVIFLIYMTVNMKLLKSVKPIVEGIQNLTTKQPVHLKEKGLLSEVSANINRTSEVLQSQNYQLKRKETARANWIAGVSHDIRTPLSMIMGYAGQLETNPNLTKAEQNQAMVIVRQSKKIKNLISDLNLASKLEYNMQPIKWKQENLVALVRQVVVDFINTDIDQKYPIEWMTEETLTSCVIYADKDLLKRAVSNLIQNSINHNEDGCNLYVCVKKEQNQCAITVEDDGVGATKEQIEVLNHTPHYMVCDDNTTEQRHGLGLLIVKQIVESHHGTVLITNRRHGGFSVTLTFPL